MKKPLNFFSLSAVMACLVFTACDNHVEPPKSPGTGGPDYTGKLLPVTIGTGKSQLTFDYDQNSNLQKIAYGKDSSWVMDLDKSGKPSMIGHYKNNSLTSFVTYEFDSAGRVIAGNQYQTEGISDNAMGHYELRYNEAGLISAITFFDLQGKLLRQLQWEYDTSGNMMRELNTSTSVLTNFTYDNKNGMFKNVPNILLFALEDPNLTLLSTRHNMVSCKSTKDDTQLFSYLYTPEDYPSQMTTKSANNSKTVKIMYQRLE